MTDRRSSWTRQAVIGAELCYIKTYDYADGASRRRGAFRNTFWARSRATREARALAWLRAAGFAAPEPLLVWEQRRLGWLRRATLVSGAWPGQDLDRLLPNAGSPVRDGVLTVLREQVERMHRAGFRHRNLDPRNVLARSEPAPTAPGGIRWQVAFLDAPRYRLRRPVPPHLPAPADRLARGDHQRLARGLLAHGIQW